MKILFLLFVDFVISLPEVFPTRASGDHERSVKQFTFKGVYHDLSALNKLIFLEVEPD